MTNSNRFRTVLVEVGSIVIGVLVALGVNQSYVNQSYVDQSYVNQSYVNQSYASFSTFALGRSARSLSKEGPGFHSNFA